MGAPQVPYAIRAVAQLRAAGITAVPYLDANKKFKNQIEFADKINADFSVIIGENERESKMFAVKNMDSGVQENLDAEQMINLLKNA